MNLIEITLNNYAREARNLKERLFYSPFDTSKREDCELYLRLLTRYEFITKMFNDMNCFHWSDEDFDIGEKL